MSGIEPANSGNSYLSRDEVVKPEEKKDSVGNLWDKYDSASNGSKGTIDGEELEKFVEDKMQNSELKNTHTSKGGLSVLNRFIGKTWADSYDKLEKIVTSGSEFIKYLKENIVENRERLEYFRNERKLEKLEIGLDKCTDEPSKNEINKQIQVLESKQKELAAKYPDLVTD